MSDPITMRRISDTAAEVMIYGDIGSMFDDGITAKMFAEELKGLGNIKELNVRMNSIGGEVFEAVAIYNTLVRHPATVTVDVDGVALSAASLVMMAGKRIRAAQNSLIMVHNPNGRAMGTAEDMRHYADRLDKIESTVRQVYSRRTGLDESAIDDMMASETWMTADEAVANGFADEVTGPQRVTAYVERDRYRHVPQRLVKPKQSVIAEYKKRIASQKV